MVSGQSINRLVHQISLQFFSLCNRKLRESDLTKAQLDVIRFLYERQKEKKITMQKDIEKYFSISNPTVSNLLTRLENKDFITRSHKQEDRRARYIELTQKAISVYESLQDSIKTMEDQMTIGIDAQNLEEGRQFLEMILHNLKEWKGEEND